jgi:hypothetical protein
LAKNNPQNFPQVARAIGKPNYERAERKLPGEIFADLQAIPSPEQVY